MENSRPDRKTLKKQQTPRKNETLADFSQVITAAKFPTASGRYFIIDGKGHSRTFRVLHQTG
jgi:hypothetical protein